MKIVVLRKQLHDCARRVTHVSMLTREMVARATTEHPKDAKDSQEWDVLNDTGDANNIVNPATKSEILVARSSNTPACRKTTPPINYEDTQSELVDILGSKPMKIPKVSLGPVTSAHSRSQDSTCSELLRKKNQNGFRLKLTDTVEAQTVGGATQGVPECAACLLPLESDMVTILECCDAALHTACAWRLIRMRCIVKKCPKCCALFTGAVVNKICSEYESLNKRI
mmetsp:Transcript_6131/g.13093  ORF Transcript_6131/g.13093 Transcript_6131/m.13093 type:complete len:226 (+) Transcript_6131:49-726(+)